MIKTTNFFNDARRTLGYMFKNRGKIGGSGRIKGFFGKIFKEMKR